MPTALPPGVTTFKITTTAQAGGASSWSPSLPATRSSRRRLDVENGLDKNRIKALKRFEANTTLLGGASASRDKAGKLAVDLEPGTYYAVDVHTRPARRGCRSPWAASTPAPA